MRRFRLLSLLAAMLVAGSLLGLNLRGEYTFVPEGLVAMEAGKFAYGFPCKAVAFPADIYYDNNAFTLQVQLALNGLKKQDLQRVEQGWMDVDWNNGYIDKPALTVNLLVLIASGIAVLFACEFLLRRRESRGHAA